MKKKSIFLKLFSMFLLFTFLVIGIFWILQVKFLDQYYHYQKIHIMKGYSQEIGARIQQEGLSESTREYISKMLEKINGRIIILDRQENILYYEGMMGFHRMSRIPQEFLAQAKKGKALAYKVPAPMGMGNFLSVLIPQGNYIYLIQTPFQPIEEALKITQQFTFYLLGIAFLISLFLAWIFSKTITNPLVKLNKIARQMALLHFDLKWDELRDDEIGELGNTLNFLTEKLQTTIENLKIELKKEKGLEKMRKQFVARVSHELQTPITLIKGYVEAIQDDIATSEAERREYLAIIQEETHRLSRLVRDLLDLGQLESGNFKIKKEVLDLTSLVNRTLYKFEILKREKNIHLKIVSEDRPYRVLGDEYPIEQVLTNLIQNGINHCIIGGKVEIRLKDIKERVKVEVYNEGDPIDSRDLPYIWESFYKGLNKKEGTGLGLAIVKNILELHKSHYGVENTDQGVVFYFDLEKA